VLRPVSTTAALCVASDSERYVVLHSAALAISLTIARNAQRSAAVVETGLYGSHLSLNSDVYHRARLA